MNDKLQPRTSTISRLLRLVSTILFAIFMLAVYFTPTQALSAEANGSIEGTVFIDADPTDGAYNIGSGDRPMVAIGITLHGQFDKVVDSQLVGIDGSYHFDNLEAGNYMLRVDYTTLPGGTWVTYDPDGVDTPGEVFVPLGAGEVAKKQDFGYQGQGSVSGSLWLDTDPDDGDFNKDAGDMPIENVLLTLTGDFGLEAGSQLSGSDGSYSFEGLEAGSFTIRVDISTLPEGVRLIQDPDGVDTPNEAGIMLDAGKDRGGQDFFYLGQGSLGDLVWMDAEGDGLQGGTGDRGVPDITVNLINAATDQIVRTQVTDVDGNYTFEYLPAGEFVVEFVVSADRFVAAWQGSSDIDSDVVNLDNPELGRTEPIFLAAAEMRDDIDAGIKARSPSSITFQNIGVQGTDETQLWVLGAILLLVLITAVTYSQQKKQI